jgi:bacterioferritin-associated ferredoxin
MFVCVCSCVTEKDVQKFIEAGITDSEEIIEKAKLGRKCGLCILKLEEILEAREKE